LVEGVAAPDLAAGSSANAAVSADAVAKTVSLSNVVQILQFNLSFLDRLLPVENESLPKRRSLDWEKSLLDE
jgi:hypothetical protein